MPQYLLSVHNDYTAEPPSEERMAGFYEAVGAFNEELRRAGAWVFAAGLAQPSTAVVVSAHTEENTTTDGPYLEGTDHLGGFWVIEAGELNVAISWAELASKACSAPIEVRPFQGV